MSKIYKNYLRLKNENENLRYLFKSGMFYIFVHDDANYISSVLNLKLTHLNSEILKCGFPTTSLSKYIDIMDNLKIDYKIIDETFSCVESKEDYLKNREFLNLINSIKKLDINKTSPIQALTILSDLKNILDFI